MVRLRERTWPTIRNSPLSARIGRTNFTDVSRVGHSSPGLSVVCAASAMDVSSIVMLQPPCTVFSVLTKRGSGEALSSTAPSFGGRRRNGSNSAIGGRGRLPFARLCTNSRPVSVAEFDDGLVDVRDSLPCVIAGSASLVPCGKFRNWRGADCLLTIKLVLLSGCAVHRDF